MFSQELSPFPKQIPWKRTAIVANVNFAIVTWYTTDYATAIMNIKYATAIMNIKYATAIMNIKYATAIMNIKE